MVLQDQIIIHIFRNDEMGHFSHQVIGQPLENLKDALYPYKNASKLSHYMLIDVLKLHLENARSASQDKILFFFHNDKIGHFLLQVIRQPLDNLKDMLYPYKNASKLS